MERMRTDADLYIAIVYALARELGPIEHKVGVIVADGVVTLIGYVTTVEQKVAAEKAIAGIAGVRAIAEGLHVMAQPARPLSDTTIAHEIVRVLDTIPHRSMRVTVRVEDGWVTLGGWVASPSAYAELEQALDCVPGVRGITSEVRVGEAGVLV
jgi:osmotically-inducible protein OsmY